MVPRYYCSDCGHVEEVEEDYGVEWPEAFICDCEHTGPGGFTGEPCTPKIRFDGEVIHD